MKNIEKALLDPNLDRLAEQKIAQAAAETETIKRAAATPLPGPTRDIFKTLPDIVVGRWKVRPIYDIDFVTLAELNHPISTLMEDSIAGAGKSDGYLPKGPTAWILFWIMTRDPDAYYETTPEEAQREARAEFGRQPFVVLMELYKAVVRQIEISTSAEVLYGAPAQEGEVAQNDVLPKS